MENTRQSNAVKSPNHYNTQNVSESTTNGHVPSPTSALDKEATSLVPEKTPGATTTIEGAQTILGPIDRLVAAKKSRNISRRVLGSARLCRSLDYHVKFIPEQKIRELVDPKAVSLELTRSRKGSYVTKDPESFCKILAILYLLDLPTKIRLFVSSNVCDAHLPLEILPGTKESDGTTVLRSMKDQDAPLVFFKRRGDAEDFVKHQWSVLVFIFLPHERTRVPHHTLHDDEILPFCSQKLTDRQGASGKVFRTWIHPDHHCWDWNKEKNDKNNTTCNTFAIKTLQSKDRCNFNQEVRVLKRLSKERHRHPHLITLLASFEKKHIFSLIFPLAEADLFGFWENNEHPTKTASLARWIAEQCRGLSEALSRIHRWQTFSGSSIISEEESESDYGTTAVKSAPQHDTSHTDRVPRNYFGVHGDLKPENILWYPDLSSEKYGILKITDFGTARFSKDFSRPGVMPNSPSYRSPEFEIQESYSPACDVWALGCIYLEFITWFSGGRDLLEEFGNKRLGFDERFGEIESDRFFTIYYPPEDPEVKQAKVKDSVVTLIKELLTHPTCIEFEYFQELLTIIRDKMLVVHLTRPDTDNGTDDNPLPQKSQYGSEFTRRKSSGQVAGFLRSMSVFVNDVVELSRQNTQDSNAIPEGSGIIPSIPDIVQTSTSSPQSPLL